MGSVINWVYSLSLEDSVTYTVTPIATALHSNIA